MGRENGNQPGSRCADDVVPAVVGVVSVAVEDLGGLLLSIPAGAMVCLELGDRRWVDLPDLAQFACATWEMRSVTVRGTDPQAVRYAVDYLTRTHQQQAAVFATDPTDQAELVDRAVYRWYGSLDRGL